MFLFEHVGVISESLYSYKREEDLLILIPYLESGVLYFLNKA